MLYQDSVGSPQGSLLSPLIFLIYIADVELWVDDVSVHGYADDTQSSYSSENEEDIVTRLEESAKKMLTYMASNSLSANPKKTGFMMISIGFFRDTLDPQCSYYREGRATPGIKSFELYFPTGSTTHTYECYNKT